MSRFWRVVLLGVVAIVVVELARHGLRVHFGWRTPLPGADWAVCLLVGFGAGAPPRLRASAAAGALVAGAAVLSRLAVAPVPAWTAPWLAFLALVTGGLMVTGALCGLLGGFEARRRARRSRNAGTRALIVLLALALAAPRVSLAQASHDTAFMARALGLMERAVPSGDMSGDEVATLADRVAIHRGQLQRYGTQAKLEHGRVILDPIADSAHVDERRRALGMLPLAEYVRMLDSLYTAQAKPR